MQDSQTRTTYHYGNDGFYTLDARDESKRISISRDKLPDMVLAGSVVEFGDFDRTKDLVIEADLSCEEFVIKCEDAYADLANFNSFVRKCESDYNRESAKTHLFKVRRQESGKKK